MRISDYAPIKNNEGIFIVIRGCEIDTNKDKYLNSKDLQKLYLYDIEKEEVKLIEMLENHTCLELNSYEFLTDNISQFGIDRNKDGFFNRDTELKVPMIIDVVNARTISMIQNDQINKLQNILEGK